MCIKEDMYISICIIDRRVIYLYIMKKKKGRVSRDDGFIYEFQKTSVTNSIPIAGNTNDALFLTLLAFI